MQMVPSQKKQTPVWAGTEQMNDIEIIEIWVEKNTVRFNLEKCKVMHLGASNQKHMSLQCFVATKLAGDRIIILVNRRWMISVALGEATLGILSSSLSL